MTDRMESTPWKNLEQHARSMPHLKGMIEDSKRCSDMVAKHGDITLDYSREKLTLDAKQELFNLAGTRFVPFLSLSLSLSSA